MVQEITKLSFVLVQNLKNSTKHLFESVFYLKLFTRIKLTHMDHDVVESVALLNKLKISRIAALS